MRTGRGENGSTATMTSLADDLYRCGAGVGPLREVSIPAGGALPSATSLSDRDVVHLARLLGLEVPRALVLVLKRQEEAAAQRGKASELGGGEGPLGNRERRAPRQSSSPCGCSCGGGDAADRRELFAIFEEEQGYASRNGYRPAEFDTLVHDCILTGLQRLSIHGPEMEVFLASHEAERLLLRDADPTLREQYWLKHCQWQEMEDEVGQLLLEVETQALENERVRQRWMGTFGPSYLALMQAQIRCISLEGRIQRKQEDPGLTREQLALLERRTMHEQDREVERLGRILARTRVSAPGGLGGMPPDEDDLSGYEEDCRRLLREIYRLTHPDAVGQHGFTEAQRERLTGCYREAVGWGNPGALADEEVFAGRRSLEALEALLAAVRRVWQHMGLHVNESAMIQGETIAQRIAWLEERIAELDEEARSVRADLLTVASDPDVREKRASMASQSLIAHVTEEMEARTARFLEQAGELEAQLERLFEGGG